MRVLLQNKKTGRVISIENAVAISYLSNTYHITAAGKTSHYSAKEYTISIYN